MIDRIHCRNFRRIASADLEIRPGITVVLGLNGAGKSSIMEALMFCLFGKAKANTKKETVRRKGADEDDPTFTAVDFTLGGKHYRCRRWYSKKMSALADLRIYADDEYEALVAAGDPMALDKSLGEELANSATGVTVAVESIIGVSYDGFKASFMAQQKELDAMGSLTPETRKKFFLDLLGYSKLDDIKPELSRRRRDAEKAVEIIERQNLSVPALEREIKQREKDIAASAARIEKGLGATAKKKAEYEAAAAAYEESRVVSEKAQGYEQDLSALRSERAELASSASSLKETIEINKKKAAGYDEDSPLASRAADARDKAAKAREYARIKADKEALEGSLSVRRATIAENAAKAKMLAKKVEREPDLEGAQTRLSALKEKRAAVVNGKTSCETSLAGMRDLLAGAESGRAVKCPTCGSEIGSGQGRVHLRGEISELEGKVKAAAEETAALDAQVKAASDEVELARLAVRTYNKDLKDKETLERENELLSADLETSERRIGEFAVQLEEKKADALGAVELRRVEEEIAVLNRQLTREKEMKDAYYAVIRDETALTSATKRISEIDESGKAKQAFLKENAKAISSLAGRAAKKDRAWDDYEKYSDLLSSLQQQKAKEEALLETAGGNLANARKQAEMLSAQKQIVEDYTAAQQVVERLRLELPARIAPRLALEASSMLDAATNGRYSLLELDGSYEVYVYTDDDVRPMSMMSGGETDVVSLCVRIAIAKMILEATGITEQTFIFDEIFGALDDDRRESTCMALRNIAKDMSKIVCITHIDEVKDMADWTYVVEMDENGASHVREQTTGQAGGTGDETVQGESDRQA